jgi:hypothetical protein
MTQAIDNLTDGFLAKAHAPIDTLTHRVQEVEHALDKLETQLETEHHQVLSFCLVVVVVVLQHFQIYFTSSWNKMPKLQHSPK